MVKSEGNPRTHNNIKDLNQASCMMLGDGEYNIVLHGGLDILLAPTSHMVRDAGRNNPSITQTIRIDPSSKYPSHPRNAV
jgi:hypothetical protein